MEHACDCMEQQNSMYCRSLTLKMMFTPPGGLWPLPDHMAAVLHVLPIAYSSQDRLSFSSAIGMLYDMIWSGKHSRQLVYWNPVHIKNKQKKVNPCWSWKKIQEKKMKLLSNIQNQLHNSSSGTDVSLTCVDLFYGKMEGKMFSIFQKFRSLRADLA